MNANAELELATCPQCQKPGQAPASAHLRDRLCSSECIDAYFADSSHFKPGDGATITIGGDCYPATILSVTRCRIVVRRDRCARANLFLPDPTGEIFAFRITKVDHGKRMKALPLVFALAALASGCACPTYTFDGNWTGDEQAQVMAGFEEWAGPLSTQGIDLPAVKVIRIDGACPSETEGAELGHEHGAAFSRAQIVIWADCIETSNPPVFLQSVAAHEMGHALGLGHYDAVELSVMRTQYHDAARTVQPIDIKHAKGQ